MNLKLRKYHSQLGSTLVEVILVTAVVATVLTALAASVSMSAQNTNRNQTTTMATSLAQEMLEVFHRERYALGWESFRTALGSGTYCLNDLPADSASFSNTANQECAGTEFITDTNYQREAVVTISSDQVRVVSVVSWMDGHDEKQIEVEQIFKEIN